jgi:hypothetical protein
MTLYSTPSGVIDKSWTSGSTIRTVQRILLLNEFAYLESSRNLGRLESSRNLGRLRGVIEKSWQSSSVDSSGLGAINYFGCCQIKVWPHNLTSLTLGRRPNSSLDALPIVENDRMIPLRRAIADDEPAYYRRTLADEKSWQDSSITFPYHPNANG